MPDQKIIGLHISDHSLAAVEMEQSGDGGKIIAAGQLVLPSGVVERGSIKDGKRLAAAVREVFAKALPRPFSGKRIVFGIGGASVFFHFLPFVESEEATGAAEARREAGETMPIAKGDLVLAQNIRRGAVLSVLTVGTSRKFLVEWEDFFKSLGLSLAFFDCAALACGRGQDSVLRDGSFCLANFGAGTISLSFFIGSELRHYHEMQYGGDYIDGKLAEAMHAGREQALAARRKALLLPENGADPAQEFLRKIFTHISEELLRNSEIFRTECGKSEDLKTILFGSDLPSDLPDFLREKGVFGAISAESQDIAHYGAIGGARRFLDARYEADPTFAATGNSFLFGSKAKVRRRRKRSNIVIPGAVLIIFLFLYFLIFQKPPVTDRALAPLSVPSERNSNNVAAPSKEIADDKAEIKTETQIPDESLSLAVKIVKKIIIKEIGGSLNVRQAPDRGAEALAQVAPGMSFEIFDGRSGWYKIEYEAGKYGWVFGEYVDVHE